VPIHPPFLGRVAGPMTRTVEDGALLMNVISRPDARDYASLPHDDRDHAKGLHSLPLKGLKVGVITAMQAGLPADPAIVRAVKAAAKALAAEGAIVTPVEGYLTHAMLDGICRFFEARSYGDVAKLKAAEKKKILPYIVEWATWRARKFTGEDVMSGFLAVQAMREAATKALAPFDFLLSPCTCPVNYAAEAHSPTDDPHRALDHIPFTVAQNFSEQPAATVNWSYDKAGFPIGVQVTGHRFDDIGVIRLCAALEKLRPEQRAWPVVG
jgi:aspartyl-tRNA(Asn)/glutamyl-tRNA(Gln) amidotransferase subunit A